MYDKFETHKEVHIKLKKETHSALRIYLFKKQLSMQEMFEEFSNLVTGGDQRALRMVDDLLTKKMKQNLEMVKNSPKLSELDQETIYNLLQELSPISKQIKDDEDE